MSGAGSRQHPLGRGDRRRWTWAAFELGQGDPESESFVAFQRYVQALERRGVILAVCSKNTESVAREVFEKHPEMVLRLDDIACFVANWDDKATNLARIANQLNIGLNSLVFVDDNPAERSDHSPASSRGGRS